MPSNTRLSHCIVEIAGLRAPLSSLRQEEPGKPGKPGSVRKSTELSNNALKHSIISLHRRDNCGQRHAFFTKFYAKKHQIGGSYGIKGTNSLQFSLNGNLHID